MAVLQLDPASGGPLAYLGTFLLASGFYGITAFLAARYALGDVAFPRALAVGAVVALVSLLLQQFGPAIVIPVTLAVDFVALRQAYGLALRTTAFVTGIHFTVAVILGITIFNLIRLLSTAPG